LKGRRILTGLVMFYIACSLGAIINLQIAATSARLGLPWIIAGTCGLAVGAVWNYGISSFTTWRVTKRRSSRRTADATRRQLERQNL